MVVRISVCTVGSRSSLWAWLQTQEQKLEDLPLLDGKGCAPHWQMNW